MLAKSASGAKARAGWMDLIQQISRGFRSEKLSRQMREERGELLEVSRRRRNPVSPVGEFLQPLRPKELSFRPLPVPSSLTCNTPRRQHVQTNGAAVYQDQSAHC